MPDFQDKTESSLIADTKVLLTPLEAALHLGITPELLFFYTSNSFQKGTDHTRRLETHTVHGESLFLRTELDSFDHYLQQPWAEVGQKRRDIPQKILAYLAAESCGACTRCGNGVGIETAHIDSWATSRSNYHHNLLRICSSCHSEHDLHQSLSTEELRKLKAASIDRIRTQLKLRINSSKVFPPPSPDPLFLGHTTELSELQEALRMDRFVIVLGPGGIGKTQLTLKALAHTKTTRAVLWIDVERYGDISGVRTALEAAIRDQVSTQFHGDAIDQLDAIHACLVLDGLEHLHGSALDAIDDWICHLQARTSTAQIFVTSQVNLQRAHFERQIFLNGIDKEASRNVLKYFVRLDSPFDNHCQDAIVTFADGHPLTLRLSAMLVNFFGSWKTACDQIKKRGVDLLKVQKRVLLDKHTSLKVCLSLAYDSLDPEEKQLLFLASNAPGGLFSSHIESGILGIKNGRTVIANIRRWSLVRIEETGHNFERIYVLSPIAHYVISRWRTDAPKEAHELTKKIASEFVVMAAVINSRSEVPDEIPYMLARIKQELPNLLRVFDYSEYYQNDSEISHFTSVLCSVLMRYFFVLRLGDLGHSVMLRGARIALRDGKQKIASDLLSQMIGLMVRSNNHTELDIALSMFDEMEREEIDFETRGNILLSRAFSARMTGDIHNLEFQARRAISHFYKSRNEHLKKSCLRQEPPSPSDLESIENDLSSSFFLLGDSLLTKRFYRESADAYRTSLSWLRGSAIAVNDGQLYHQIGNCESGLGNHEAAARCYSSAVKRFHGIEMRGYLSNALGELGHTILDLGCNNSFPTLPDLKAINDGLADMATDLALCYSTIPLNFDTCAIATRKLFGLIVLTSLSEGRAGLGEFSTKLTSELLEPVTDKINATGNKMDKIAIHHLKCLLILAASINAFERTAQQSAPSTKDIEDLAKVCCLQGPWADLKRMSFVWLSLYLRHRWKIHAGTGIDLQNATDCAIAGETLKFPNTN